MVIRMRRMERMGVKVRIANILHEKTPQGGITDELVTRLFGNKRMKNAPIRRREKIRREEMSNG